MLKTLRLVGLWKTMKIEGIMKKIPKKSDFPDFTQIFPRFWPDFPKILTIFQNSRTSEPLIVEICMTTQIEAKKVYFTNMLSSIFQLMPIFFNHRSKSAKKRQNRHNRENRENRGKLGKFGIFCKNSKIYIEIHILT